jgi:hypothetical protein
MDHPRALVTVVAVLCLTPACNCGGASAEDAGQDAGQDAGVCVSDGGVSFLVTTPATFACHVAYTATFQVANGTCSPVTVSALHITETRTSGVCAPGPFTFDYVPTTPTVPPGKTVTVLDLTGAKFCCTGAACPANFPCVLRFDFRADTSVGSATTSSPGTLELGGCTELCP